jgi:hypothetical protein
MPSDFSANEVIKSLGELAWCKAETSGTANTVLAPSHVMQQATAAVGSPDVSSPGHQLARARGIMKVAQNKFQEHNHSVESGHPVGPLPDQQRSEHFARKFHEAKAVVNHFERQGIQDAPEHHSDWEMHHMLNPTPSEEEGGHWKQPGSISMRQAHGEFQMQGQTQPGFGGLSATTEQVEQMRQAAQQPQAQMAPAPGQSPEPTPTPSRDPNVPQTQVSVPKTTSAPVSGAVPGIRPIGAEAQTGVFKRSLDLLSGMMKAAAVGRTSDPMWQPHTAPSGKTETGAVINPISGAMRKVTQAASYLSARKQAKKEGISTVPMTSAQIKYQGGKQKPVTVAGVHEGSIVQLPSGKPKFTAGEAKLLEAGKVKPEEVSHVKSAQKSLQILKAMLA